MTAAGQTDASMRPSLPESFSHTQPAPQLIFQGAEALLYRTHFLCDPDSQPFLPAALKFRPAKAYRHPLLDAKLTRHRILAEARMLAKLRRERVPVPALYALDWDEGWMLMEWIDGQSVRAVLDETLESFLVAGAQDSHALWQLMAQVGAAVGKMHAAGVAHGDLTTSNLLLGNAKSDSPGGIVVIDFGLAEVTYQTEDRAVDLYVLERAFGSTHRGTEALFGQVLKAYESSFKDAKPALKRLEEVRLRGRKKIMIG